MRVLLITSDESRARLLAEGLAEAQLFQSERYDAAEAAAFAPDIVVVAGATPDRETLEALLEAGAAKSLPVVVFVDRSEPAVAEAAVQAGVAAFVVDGLAPGRVQSVMEVALTRFRLTQAMREDLAKAQADLAARKTVERAKGLLMKERGLDEEAAYRLLRKLAMDNGRPIGAVAADLVAYAEVLKGAR